MKTGASCKDYIKTMTRQPKIITGTSLLGEKRSFGNGRFAMAVRLQ